VKRILATLVAVASLTLVASGAQAPLAARAANPNDPVPRATQFRLGAGLRADSAYVQQSLLDATTFSNTSYGVPLTPVEAAEIDRRIAVQTSVDDAIAWAVTRSNFGGAYMDQSSGGTPVFQVVENPSAFQASLASHLPAGVTARVVSVKNSRADLEALKERIWADRSALATVGIDLQSAALDIRNNQVLVEVEGLTEQATAELVSRYGSVGTTENEAGEADACNSRTDCAPMKGGLRIVVVGHSTIWCTSGFNVRLAGTTTMRVLTAGHCLSTAPGGITAGWSHHGVQFGTGKNSTWANNANADAGLISQGALTIDNQMYGVSSADIRSVRGWMAISGQNVGDYLCRSGAASGFWCGNITLEDRVKDVELRSINHQWVVNFDAIPGDSGAPYFTTASGVTTAWGIHSDSTDANPPGGSAWYSPIPWVQSTLQASGFPITFCTDQYCGL
jgi:streptogrisin C